MTDEQSLNEICCPEFKAAPWDEQEIAWEGKRFVTDRVRCFFHIPLNFGSVMKRNCQLIEEAGAKSPEMITLSDENSPWSSNVYIHVTKDVPGTQMATISGNFLSKVFEGPYRNIGAWIKEMQVYVKEKNKALKKFYFYYTTCPKCAKKYGKNYVVLLAQV